MTKKELITNVATETGCTKKDVEAVVSAMTSVVTDALVAGDKVYLVGLGTFETAERASRVGRNPQTGETMTIAARKAPKFKASKTLKDAVNA